MDNEEKIYNLLEKIYIELQYTKTDVGNIKYELTEVRSDVSVIKSEISEVKSEISVIKSEISEVKSEISVMKNEIKTVRDTVIRIENDHGQKLKALFDGYKQNSEKLDRIELEVAKHEEIILRRIS